MCHGNIENNQSKIQEHVEFYLKRLGTDLVDEGHAVDVLYLDFAKAFDKVPHGRLIAKCKGLGIDGKVLAWIQEWLSGCQQRVVLNGNYSGWGEVLSGVPQGSVLGPTLFVIFINDIDCAMDVTGSHLFKFADDTKWAMGVDTEEQSRAFQEGIQRLESWSREWQMLFNSGKCLQCAKAATRANQVLGQLARAVGYRDKDTFLNLYCVYVRPHLEYAIQSWSPWLVQDKDVLEKVQKRALKIVSNLKGRTYEERLLETNMTTLEARRVRGDLIQMYRIMSGKDDVRPSIWFHTMADFRGTGVDTRQAMGLYNVHPQESQGQVRKNFFSQRVVAPWNALPDQVKQATSVNMFKNSLDDHMKQGVFLPT